MTVEQYVRDVLQISGRALQKLTRNKAITLNFKPVYLQKKLRAGDTLRIVMESDQSYGVVPEPGGLDIVYEDEQCIVCNKPAHTLVHPTESTKTGTLANFLAHYFHSNNQIVKIRPIHRLDRDTTGCVLFAKQAQIQTNFEQQLREGTLKRTYLAIVDGMIDSSSGVIEEPIGIHPIQPNRRQIDANGSPAVTKYHVL